jgi:hypothetical protein
MGIFEKSAKVFDHRQVIGDGPVYTTEENIVLFKMLVDVIMLSSP